MPWRMLVYTVVGGLALVGLRIWERQLTDTVAQFDAAVLTVVSWIIAALIGAGWLVWLWRSGRRALVGLVVLVAVILAVLFKPVFRGNMAIVRWEPRFWAGRTLVIESVGRGANLAVTTADDFPQFLGPERNAIIADRRITRLAASDSWEPIWRRPVGPAWSGFVVVNGFAITMEQEGDEELVTCRELKTGDVCWVYRHPQRHEHLLGGVGPRATPTVADGLVYAVGATGNLVCLRGEDGSVVWQANIPELVGASLTRRHNARGEPVDVEQSTLSWGRSGSPLVYEGMVIVPGGGPVDGPHTSLVAFDRLTGQLIWKGGDQPIGYSSPSVAIIAGEPQILIVNESSAAGHDPATGCQLWSHERIGHSNADANTSQVTVVDERRVLLSKGYGLGAELVRIDRDADGQYTASTVWKNPGVLKTKLTNPVIYQGFAYGLSDGWLECVSLADGSRQWKERGFGHGQLLLVGDRLLVHSERGRLSLVDADPREYRLIESHATIDGVCWNTLCLYGRYLLVRSDLEAACYEISGIETIVPSESIADRAPQATAR